MERAIQGSDAWQQTGGQRRVGGCGDSFAPFQLPDESPTSDEWRLHHDAYDPDTDCPLGFKEFWSVGKAISKRYHRYDWKEASLDRALGSWQGDKVITEASRFLGVDQVSCTYSIRVRGVSITLSGGSRALLRLVSMADRIKRSELQFATSAVESVVSRGCPEEETPKESE
ncbi:p19 protein [Maize necrotic streak virus]|uniref:RNA silencing suppressor p19 n=1 Tax=Maize necrotic streak virus TaxID=137556 RepID=Q9E348_MNESV|nr:p19 protein [Maize necrotic streak virus]AAG21219.2 p19 protein [Maize necrotic streak virus]